MTSCNFYEFEGTRLQMTYPVVKLADYRDRIEELETSDNVFALIVLAHLQSQKVRENEGRLDWKRRITRNLLERPLDEKRRWKALRLVDWLIDLPIELNNVLWDEIKAWKERNIMPFVTGLERMAQEEGLKKGERIGLLEGLELSLELKSGEAGKLFYAELKAIPDTAKLRAVHQAILRADSIVDLKKLL